MADPWRGKPDDVSVSTTIPKEWFDRFQKWMKVHISPTASTVDGVRTILAKELGFPMPGETIKHDFAKERAEKAEAYLDALAELGSYKKVAEKYGKSPASIRATINRYERDQRLSELRSQKHREQVSKPDPMWDD